MTTEDIARHLGISRGTVSRALNNRSRISEETRRRVLDAVYELGYEPNLAARALVGAKTIKSAISIFSQPEYFWDEVKEGIYFAHDNLKHFGFEFELVENRIEEPEEQVAQLYRLYENGVRALAVAPNDPVLLDDVVRDLTASGVSVITFNVDIPSKERLCYLGSDYYQEGRLAADTLACLMGGKGKAVAVTFSSLVQTITHRIEGFFSVMKHYPNVNVVLATDFLRSGHGAYEKALAFIREHPDLNGIFVSFGILDEVARAVEDSGLGGMVRIVGYDLSDPVEQYIRRGTIDAAICHDPIMQGYYATILLYNYAAHNHRPPANVINSKLEIVVRENLDSYTDERNQLSALKVVFGK